MARYQLGERIGSGGMAEVFRGIKIGVEGFARDVAVKRVLPHLTDSRVGAMFVREARIVSQLSHANICSVLDFDRDEKGQLFLAMELVEGKDLDAILEAGNIPPAVAGFIITEVLRGLGHAHARRIIHRDVSPRNVLVSWDGAVKVSDFGIAVLRDAAVSTTIRGKPGYMSPEQAEGMRVDTRSDLFSVGIILWELLTWTPLFPGSSHEAIAQLLHRRIPRPRDVQVSAPPELEAIAMRLLARNREARYATTQEVIDDLTRSSVMSTDGRGELTRWLARRFHSAVDTKAVTAPRIVRPRRIAADAPIAPRRSRRMFALVVAAACLFGSAAALVVDRVKEAPVPKPTSVPLPIRSSASSTTQGLATTSSTSPPAVDASEHAMPTNIAAPTSGVAPGTSVAEPAGARGTQRAVETPAKIHAAPRSTADPPSIERAVPQDLEAESDPAKPRGVPPL